MWDIYFSFKKRVEAINLGSDNMGLFAREDIRRGEIIWHDLANQYPAHINLVTATKAEIESWPEAKRTTFLHHAWQESADRFIGNASIEDVRKDAMNYYNHSCDPNCWFATDNDISARRDIKSGEQLTIDYAMCDSTFTYNISCLCSTPHCRGFWLPDAWKIPRLQRVYTNHWRLYILEMIEEEEKKRRNREANEQQQQQHRKSDSDEEDRIIELTDANKGVGKMFNLHKCIEVRGSKAEGRGLFATQLIPKGTVVWDEQEPLDEVFYLMESKELADLDPETRRIIEYFAEVDMSVGKIRAPLSAEVIERDCSNFWNHSCNPNTWFISDLKLAAMRDIQAGEELTYDYATSKPLAKSSFECRCGTNECRKIIDFEGYKLPHLRMKYGRHWVSHWLNFLDSESNSSI